MVGDSTDDDFEKIDGERDKLVGRHQERYGYAKERAEAEVDRRLREYDHVSPWTERQPGGRGCTPVDPAARRLATRAVKSACLPGPCQVVEWRTPYDAAAPGSARSLHRSVWHHALPNMRPSLRTR